MEPSEESVNALVNMGFSNVEQVRRALKLSRDDVNEAVAILTSEHTTTSFDTLDDIEMKDMDGNRSNVHYGPDPPPPSYDEAVEPIENEEPSSSSSNLNKGDNDSMEFPTTNLYELEGRVFTEQWSIPYKKEESLGKCLLAATRLAKEGKLEQDDNCVRFVERCMPEAFRKLMTSSAVQRWGPEIQDGIYNMLQLLVTLIATRLQHQPVPTAMLQSLLLAFNLETEFHIKNRMKKADKLHYEEIFGINQTYAISPPYNTYKDPCGWLVNLINKFAENGGIEQIKACIIEPSEEVDACTMTALLQPLGACAEYLNPLRVSKFLLPVKAKVKKYVEDVSDSELKQKKAISICDLLSTLKILCINFWPEDVREVDNLRLDIALRMLKSPHFNAKMNSLKEIRKMIDESTTSRRTAMEEDVIADWLVDNGILTVALEGNIDQSQYCDRLKGIVEFLGTKLSLEELTKIWKMQQNDQHMTVVDNIHSIMAAAAVYLNSAQLDHLFRLIQKAWKEENDHMREKLLTLIGTIGRESKQAKTTNKVLELLWDLAHLPAIPTSHLEHALKEHLTILSESYLINMQVKNKYISKCVEDVKRGSLVVPAMRQLHLIAKGKNNKYDKSIPTDLHKNHDIIKLISHSLMKSHRAAVNVSGGNQVTPTMLVDGRYTHAEHVQVHLEFLAFILEVGVLYLHWHRAREIWECLVSNHDAIEYDKETCFNWFKSGLNDLEAETQQQLFTQKLLKQDPASLSPKNFDCLKAYFESVNQNNQALRKSGPNLVVEKLDLLGLEFMWQVALENPNEEIASVAIHQLMKMYYTGLAMKLKKDTISVHKRFIAECYKRLEEATVTLGGSAIAYAISKANKALTAATLPDVASLPSPSRCVRLLTIERLLKLAETYVTTVEDQHTCTRTILPHEASYQGHPITIHVSCDIPKIEFTIVCHSNESLRSVRTRIAVRLKTNTDNVQIAANDTMLLPCKDQKLLRQLSFEEEQLLNVKQTMVTSIQYNARNDEQSTVSFQPRTAYAMELERSLPGVVMATGGQVFEMLYQLADLDETKITQRVRNLLRLIPTDPSIIEALDNICRYNDDAENNEGSPGKPPRQVLQDLFTTSSHSSMSAFRVLYNLEVLNACLMPANQEDNGIQSTRRFREAFLNAGGLSLIVSILQKDAIPADADEETRRGCYSICIQLARFVLCGQTMTALMENDLSISSSQHEATLDSSGFSSSSVGSSSPRKSSLWNRMNSFESAGGDFSGKEGTAVAISVIQTMSPTEYTSMIAQFMRVTWAAAAGRLYLASTNQIKESNAPSFNMGRRSRQSSTGSTASSSSESDVLHLQSGVCLLKSKVSTGDAMIARDALELLVACLQLRSQLLNSFYSLPSVNDFIIEILLASGHQDVRRAAMEQLYILATTHIPDSPYLLQPRLFLIQVLIKAHVPLWITSTYTRASNLRLLSQCKQYFDLRCLLFERLTSQEQSILGVNPRSMLEDEIEWLGNFESGAGEESAVEMENQLITGHLQLMKSLLTCENVDKKQIGKQLISNMLNDYLYPASRLILANANNPRITSNLNLNPKLVCNDAKSAAYDLLVTLCEDCAENLRQVAQHLSLMHHQPTPSVQPQWDLSPPVDGRSPSGYVGLKNGGATCYMNSVIQLLYMVPGIREEILSCHDNDDDEETVFYQLQMIFGHLMESKLQFYEPDRFWRVFKLWGEPVNIREQQDAFEFFTDLTDQIDEFLKANGKKQVFKSKFQGVFTDQKICQDCPHRYEREEEFFALNLTVKSQNLEASLEQFVRGEMLEGDNAYLCEKCNEKRNTIKRTCIKTLPPVLVIHLKRFGYDWEAGRALKFDDHFKFPWVLDMEPYTSEGMSRRENNAEQQEVDAPTESITKTKAKHSKLDELYQLVGVLVHSGQANAGHYYSFIRDRWGTSMNNASKGKWFKFNDTVVEGFDMTDSTIETECFGGSYKPKLYDHGTSYSETRLRYWSGYMLFYEKIEGTKTPDSTLQRSSVPRAAILKHDSEGDIQVINSSPEFSPIHNSDELNELSALVQKGERRGIFVDKMSPTIQKFILDDNLQYMRNRDIFSADYFNFIRSLVSCNSSHIYLKDYSAMAETSIELVTNFLLNTYFRTKKSFRNDQDEWEHCIEVLLRNSPHSCAWFIKHLNTEIGTPYIRQYLLECPSSEVRYSFTHIVETALRYFINHNSSATMSSIPELNGLIEHLLCLLDKDVASYCRNCAQYFLLLSTYLNAGVNCCVHLFERGAYRRLMTFLIGQPTPNQDLNSRRWTSSHTRDFVSLHTTLANMVLHCDVSQFRSVEETPEDKPPNIPDIHDLDTLLQTPEDVKSILFAAQGRRYIREAVAACREMTQGSTSDITDMLLHCCYCNQVFSQDVLEAIQYQIITAPAHDLKSMCHLLLKLLQLKDPLQLHRLKLCVEGHDSDGLLDIIQKCNVTDSRRSYQCIKFLVTLANKCPVAKDYLVSIMAKWQWAIIWLKRKMNEHSWTPQHTSNESSSGKTFQRTMSAQDTLAEATALFEQLSTEEEEEKGKNDENEADIENVGKDLDTSKPESSMDDTETSDNVTNTSEENSLGLDEIDT
ncbi:ubiquitin carboxyl-terminal hydrolase 24-like [Anneissia japonica]|uniref:ubiquitin carboxyl-terminal hydrolase 24-like n=1 Tax=Anneissia japonica TaxID=1529436 RepID=UPI001425B4F4|nr:ubiquitin carboxyl-terminal hydrolase 24-like [Anneissia japonica]